MKKPSSFDVHTVRTAIWLDCWGSHCTRSGGALRARSLIRPRHAFAADARGTWMLIKSTLYSRGAALHGGFKSGTATSPVSHVRWASAPQPSTTAFAAKVDTFNSLTSTDIRRTIPAALTRPCRTPLCVLRSFVRGRDLTSNPCERRSRVEGRFTFDANMWYPGRRYPSSSQRHRPECALSGHWTSQNSCRKAVVAQAWPRRLL